MMELVVNVGRSKSAVVVGAGGAIGSYTDELLARSPELGQLTLLDRDRYEKKNLNSQSITMDDVTRAKALVQGERVGRINPALRVIAMVGDVEQVPLGRLRADVLLACLDPRRSRQRVNQVAYRLGTPWIDAGIRADGLLARVNVYRPGVDQPCLECAWDQRDYELIEQTYPCQPDAPALAATNAPPGLGALAAALQVLECQKIFAGQWERVALGKQVLVDAASHRHFVTRFRRNLACRFDHTIWQIDSLEQQAHELSARDALALAGCATTADAALRVEGQVFVRQLVCPRCGEVRALPWRLSGRLGAEQECVRCRRPMLAPAAAVRDWLGEGDLPAAARGDAVRSLGFQDGDVFTVRSPDGERHFELDGRASTATASASAGARVAEAFGECG